MNYLVRSLYGLSCGKETRQIKNGIPFANVLIEIFSRSVWEPFKRTIVLTTSEEYIGVGGSFFLLVAVRRWSLSKIRCIDQGFCRNNYQWNSGARSIVLWATEQIIKIIIDVNSDQFPMVGVRISMPAMAEMYHRMSTSRPSTFCISFCSMSFEKVERVL